MSDIEGYRAKIRIPWEPGAHYADDRARGDIAAMPFRQQLDQMVEDAVYGQKSLLTDRLGITDGTVTQFAVTMDPRMISRYGRGKESAFEVVPGVAERLSTLLILLKHAACHKIMSEELEQFFAELKINYNLELTPQEQLLLIDSVENIGKIHISFANYLYPVGNSYAEVYQEFPQTFSEFFGSGHKMAWNYYIRWSDGTATYQQDADRVYLKMIAAISALGGR